MDDEVRKAQRVLERAGIKMIPADHEAIIKIALDLMKTDKIFSQENLNYFTGAVRVHDVTIYLQSKDRPQLEVAQPILADGVKYYLALAQYIWDTGKSQLSGEASS